MSKNHSIKILDGLAADGDSAEFTIIVPDSKGFADTEHSAYLSFYGNVGGGAISLMKEMLDEDFYKLVKESSEINSNFPAGADEVYLAGINFKAGDKFKINLNGATTPSLFVDGTNIKFA